MPSSQVGFVGIGIPSGTASIIIKDKVNDYELLEEDLVGGVYIRVNKATNVFVNVPADLENAQPVHITQTGLGTVEVTADVGVSIHSTDGWRKCRTRYSNLTLIPTSTNVYDLVGDLAE